MPDQQPAQYAETVAPPTLRQGTCDACAEGEVEIVHEDPETEAWTCRECWNLERRAVWAAAREMAEIQGDDPDDWLDVAEAAIGAYHAVYWRAAQFDGSPDA